MCTQLIRHLERRADRFSPEGNPSPQLLLLLDEFPRFGKIERLTAAMTTLRSKGVNFCLIIQSLAQLDCIYGENERRIILDNCQYKTILQAADADTQAFLSELAGTCVRRYHSVGESLDLKSLGGNTVPVRSRSAAPFENTRFSGFQEAGYFSVLRLVLSSVLS